MNMPRPEHPNPQWERSNWRNLNGTWEFEFDFGCSAVGRKVMQKDKLDMEIVVPFCPESKLSGIAHTDFMDGVVYRKTITLSEAEAASTVMLHFGAVDYEAKLYINNTYVGIHKGGYTSFSFDISKYVSAGENTIFLTVTDMGRSKLQPTGKQCFLYESIGCEYTRTTGIWQTVWMEFLPKAHIVSAKYYPDIDNSCLGLTGIVSGKGTLTITASWEGKTVGTKTINVTNSTTFTTQLELSELHLWELGKGGLYELTFDFGDDHVKSYFGMRSAGFEGKKFMLNGKSVFMRTVLDQGYYIDGIYTAPTDADLIKDIELSYAAGFNGARLHQKVFEPRFLYHCDRLGYMVWGEYPNWGLDHSNPLATETYLNEWSESVERDFNHPSIIGWCPFNETWKYYENREKNSLLTSIYKITKKLDPTRPCIDTSGNHRVLSEVYDIHDYNQNPETFKKDWDTFTKLARENNDCIPADHPFFTEGRVYGYDGFPPFFSQPYDGQPIFISEYGGIRWVENNVEGWGYGDAPKSAEEFFARYKGITDTMLNNEDICGFCYTQLYDVEQEINGLYTYERNQKFDINIIKEINEQKAAIED